MALARTYLDWNATAPLLPPAREAVSRALDMPGNASSCTWEGRALRLEVENAAPCCGLTSVGKACQYCVCQRCHRGANLVLTPHFKMGRAPVTCSRLYVSAIEHPAVREGGRFAKSDVTEIPVTRQGLVDPEALEALLAAHDFAGTACRW